MDDRALILDLLEAGEDYALLLLRLLPQSGPVPDERARRDIARSALVDAVLAVVERAKEDKR